MQTTKQQYIVIGISDDHEQEFLPEVRKAIVTGHVFSGGVRHREIMQPHLPQGAVWIDITVPLSDVFRQYAFHEQIIVFASGDPLFFGFANTLLREFPTAELKLFPSFNSLQMLAHRLLLPYQDMRVVSLTGRPWLRFDQALIEGEMLIGVLTDREKTPSVIARRMLSFGYDNYTMAVGERLGNKTLEHVGHYTLEEAAARDYAFPNNILLRRTHIRPKPLGIPDHDFHLLDGRVNMITKMPIRLLTLHMLALHDKQSFWDIGSCTGSVSIEAKLQFPYLQITAFEQRLEGKELLESNARKFGTPGIDLHIGDFLQTGLSSVSRPDAVFIGGHGGKLIDIIRRVHSLLNERGVIVFNSVSATSRQLFEEGIRQTGRRITQTYHIQIDQHNPIDVLKAE